MKAQRKVIRGYAAVWGDLAKTWDGWEQVRRGAFTDVCARVSESSPLPMQWDHRSQGFLSEAKVPIGAIVELKEDKVGLSIRALPHQSAAAIEVMEAIEDKTIPGLSIAFPTETAEYEEIPKLGRRVLTKADLVEISAVNHPAYKATSVWVETEEYDDGQPEPAAHNDTAAHAAEGN